MSSLSPIEQMPEAEASGVYLASGIWPASGIFLASGINVIAPQQVSGVVGVSGEVHIMSGNVAVVSGAISVVSGSITVNSGTVAVSGFFGTFSGKSFISGFGYTAAVPVVPLLYDYSGTQFIPFNCLTSGSNEIVIEPDYKRGTYQGLSGLFCTAASSVPNLSGGVALSSAICNTVTVRNWSGNAPIYVGSSGSFPASGGGAGFILYGGDGLTIDMGPNMNLVFVVGSISGLLISHFGTFY